MSDGTEPAVVTAPTVDAAPGATLLARAGDTTIGDGTAVPAGTSSADVGALAEVDPQHYELRGEHARGGLGRILRARDRRLGRPVAVKELLHDSGEARARFVREVEITAGLQHPGVVPIYEAGRWPGGKPFYAMKLVAGRTLTEVIAAAPTVRDRIALLPTVIAVAETVAYAHDRRVVHRDLKPSNVLVGDFGETVVIDWGLARNLDDAPIGGGIEGADAAVDVGVTITGQVLGTPAYMAPEQARGEVVDARADVYAIGALLYHVLAGASPYRRASGNVVAAVLAAPPPSLASVCPGLAPDLLAIVDKAMARAAADRYPDAAALAADLRRFTTGQLVTVHRYSTPVLIRRSIARHRAAVVVAALALAALLVVSVISIVNVVAARDRARANERVATARAAEVVAQRNQLLLQQAESALETDPTTSLAWLEQYPLDGAEWGRVRSIAADAVSRGVARHVLGGNVEEVFSVALSADGARIATCSAGRVALWDTATGRELGSYAHPYAMFVAMTSDARTLVSTGEFSTDLWVWTLGEPAARRVRGHTGIVRTLAFAADGRTLVTGSHDGTIRIWDSTTWTSRVLRGHVGRVIAAVPLADGRIVSIGADATLRLWSGTAPSRVIGHVNAPGESLAISADDRMIAAAAGGVVYAMDVDGGAMRVLGHHDDAVTNVAFRGKDAVVSTSRDRSVRLWPLDGGKPQLLMGHDQPVITLAVAAQGWLATGDEGGTVRLWRPGAAGELEPTILHGHRLAVYDAKFSRDGRWLVTGSADRTARVWAVPRAVERIFRGGDLDLFQLVYVDGRTVVATGRDGAVRRWDTESGVSQLLGRVEKHAYAIASLDGGRSVVVGSWSGSIVRWDVRSGEERTVRASGSKVRTLAASSDGQWLAAADDDGAHLGPAANGSLQHLASEGSALGVAFSPDGRLLATTHADATVRLWEVATGREVRVLRGHTEGATRLLFTPDGSRLVTAGRDGLVIVWDVHREGHRVLRSHIGDVRALAVSHSGLRIASGGRDGTVRLWEISTGEGVALGQLDAEVRDVAFSPDDATLASASFDHTVRMWDLATRSSVPFRGHLGYVHRVAFSADGHEVASVGADGTLRVRDVFTAWIPTGAQFLRPWLSAQTSWTITRTN